MGEHQKINRNKKPQKDNVIDSRTSSLPNVLKSSQIPNCMLCPERHGCLIQLETKEWVHHICVNWHNEIWFEKDDVG